MPSPTSLSLDARDRYPACLRLAWHAASVAADTLNLAASFHFGNQWELLLDGRVKLALRGVALHLYGDGAWQPTTPDTCALDSGARLQIAPLPAPGLWSCHLRLLSGEPALLGASDRLPLGQWQGEPAFALEATVAAADLAIVSAEGLWPHAIAPNQHAILERRLALFLARERLAPYLSRMQYHAIASHIAAPSAASNDSEAKLRAHLQAVLEQSDANLLVLAHLADLDPATDLAGGNLRGADLRGLDLSGADLSGANLRGADLSDADLSEANLQRACLGGADLSGAFLSNADLRDSDLHRASLALANLGGADLRGANLLAANLSNASWSNTLVAGAQIDSQAGLADDVQASLLERGAQLVAS